MKKIAIVVFLFSFSLIFAAWQTAQKDDAAKLELGHRLFFEKNLSATQTKSCSSCHDPQFAFSDGYRTPLGIYADVLPRNTPSLFNVAQFKTLNWANPELKSLEIQMLRPLFSTHPVEMGNNQNDSSVLLLLEKNGKYKSLFHKAFSNEKNPISWKNTIAAVAFYVKNLESKNAFYDAVIAEQKSFSAEEQQGYELFFSIKTQCATCHQGRFFSNGKYYVSALQDDDLGIFNQTKKNKDRHKFRVPSLRNVALTAPYFHSGSVATLSEAVEKCQNFHQKQALSKAECQNIVHFLHTLTDSTIFAKPLFQAPSDE